MVHHPPVEVGKPARLIIRFFIVFFFYLSSQTCSSICLLVIFLDMYIVQIERRSTVVFSISDMGLTPELSSSYGFDFHTDFFDFQTKVIAEALCSGIEATLSVWETADSHMKLVSIS